jgi:hypothetical protein
MPLLSKSLRKHLAILGKIDPFIPVCVLLSLLLVEPLLKPGLPNTADGLLHFFRSALWRWAWDDGILWPRWHTLLYHGYGYPLFNFYAPLLYILTSLLSYLTPSLLTAFKAVLFLASLNYSLGLYFWARDVISRESAIVAAAAYTFATYRFRELYFQGNYAQFLAWSLYPWVLFFFHRLWREPDRLSFAGAVFSLAALNLCHNISTMLFAPVLALYLVSLILLEKNHSRATLSRAILLVSAIISAFAVSAIFWVPALAEQHFTKVHVLTKGFFDVAEHFLRMRDLLAPSPILDYRATNPPMPFNFGQFHLILAGIGALGLFRRGLSFSQRWHLCFAIAGVLLSSFMMLPSSLILWRTLPLIAFTEYPSRMYGVAFLFSSLLAGASALWVKGSPSFKPPVAIAAVAGLIISVAPYQFPRPFLPVRATPQDFVLYEKAFNVPGTTSASEYLNVWTLKVPESPAVEPDLARKVLVNGEAKALEVKAQSLRFSVKLSEPTRLSVAQFHFPGWQGWVDGKPVNLAPCSESGLICLEVPAGEHEVLLEFKDTLVRKLGKVISLLSLLSTIIITLCLKAQKKPEQSESHRRWIEGFALALAIGGILALKVWWVGPHTFWFRMYSPQGKALPARNHANFVLGGKVALIGYDLDSEVVRQGGELHLRLYWQALEPLDKDYSSFVHLVGLDSRIYAQSDSMHPAYIPTSTWNPALYVVDDHYVRIPLNAPPVAFKVRVGLYELKTMQLLGEAELPEWVNIQPRGSVKVPVKYHQAFPGEGIKLLGYNLVNQDGFLILSLYWQAERKVSRDFQVFVHLVDSQGNIITQADGPPSGGLYPTSKWLPKQIIEDVHQLPIPPASNPRAILVGLYDLATLERLPAFREDGSRWENDAVVIKFRENLW